MNTKQVIIIRKFDNFHFGKMASQIAHASMAFLSNDIREYERYRTAQGEKVACETLFDAKHWPEIRSWLENSFKKVVCYVETEEELIDLYQKALNKGLIVHKIVDSGATIFKGVPTLTCISIGPHEDSKFEDLTNHLSLLQ